MSLWKLKKGASAEDILKALLDSLITCEHIGDVKDAANKAASLADLPAPIWAYDEDGDGLDIDGEDDDDDSDYEDEDDEDDEVMEVGSDLEDM